MKLSTYLLLASGLLPALAAALPQAANPGDPSDPHATVPAVAHASPLATYMPAAAQQQSPDQLWLENNRKLSATPGMGQMMMAVPAVPAVPAAPDAPTAPAASAAAPAHMHAHTMAPPAQPTQAVSSKPEAGAQAPMDMPAGMQMDHMHH